MIIDFHTHILPPSFKRRRAEIAARDATFRALFANPKAKIATAAQLIRAMDEDGVDWAVVVGYGWCDRDIAREANDYLLDSAERHPKRIIPFCSVNPDWGDEALREVENCLDAGARGIGELHPTTQQFRLKGKKLRDLMRLAARRDVPVLVHGSEPVGHDYAGKGDTDPATLLGLAEAFPKNRLIFAHWGGGLPFYALMPEVRKALANTYFDTAASPFLYQQSVFRTVANAAGMERVLFGSDYPLLRPKRVAEQAMSGLTSKQAAEVLGGNAKTLLGL